MTATAAEAAPAAQETPWPDCLLHTACNACGDRTERSYWDASACAECGACVMYLEHFEHPENRDQHRPWWETDPGVAVHRVELLRAKKTSRPRKDPTAP